jgi:hypothetical protein
VRGEGRERGKGREGGRVKIRKIAKFAYRYFYMSWVTIWVYPMRGPTGTKMVTLWNMEILQGMETAGERKRIGEAGGEGEEKRLIVMRSVMGNEWWSTNKDVTWYNLPEMDYLMRGAIDVNLSSPPHSLLLPPPPPRPLPLPLLPFLSPLSPFPFQSHPHAL